ncbi:Peptidase S1 PA clan [Gracilaria domingensis]|nr:Peptidase S1 PA clan [Gracilaria domingensis]
MNVFILALAGILLATCEAQTICRPQTLLRSKGPSPMVASLDLHQNNLRRRRGPNPFSALLQRSIVQCETTVEVLEVPDNTTEYDGVPLDALVTIVETEVPLRDSMEAAQRALPACTGIFVSPTQILSSAHCVYHQRQQESEEPYWMFGDDNPHNTFLYAITGKVNAEDRSFNVYKLAQGCIPQSYFDAENEEVTSVMGNDLVIFQIEGEFVGDPTSIGTIAPSIVYDVAKDYVLPQYPSDINNGRSLVIDKNRTPILFEPLGSGVFFSVELASWSGSSGGPIIDMNTTRMTGSPSVVGVLMSSGWELCDSGIVPVTTGIPVVEELMTSTANGRTAAEQVRARSSAVAVSVTPFPEGEPTGSVYYVEGSPEPLELSTIHGGEEYDAIDGSPAISGEEEMV